MSRTNTQELLILTKDAQKYAVERLEKISSMLEQYTAKTNKSIAYVMAYYDRRVGRRRFHHPESDGTTYPCDPLG